MKKVVKVYSKNNCPQCNMTKRFLNENKVEFQEINIDVNPEYINQLLEHGFQSVPVVMSTNDSFAGFRPDKLKELVG